MGFVLTVTAGLVIWITLWALGASGFDSFLVPIGMVLGATMVRNVRVARPARPARSNAHRLSLVPRPFRWYVSRWGLSFAAGLLVVIVPTLFTVFPAWGLHWSVAAKVIALVIWLAAAVAAVVGAVRQGTQLDSLVKEREQQARTGAMERLIRVALTPESAGLPPDYHFQVFLPNPDRTRLIPEFDPDNAGPREGWRIDVEPPQAVTGASWRTNSYVFAKGPAVSDATYGLTAAQQARYRTLSGVAATPIQNARGNPIGVLTLSTSAAQPIVSDPDVFRQMLALAEVTARVLIDVGGKASDQD